ncbi:MAG: biotin synthase BioB [Desulfobulbaceae bacterium A2]|nr:MAG: biotin synthase BioB [Desulfobulbaceae bacterium A2]
MNRWRFSAAAQYLPALMAGEELRVPEALELARGESTANLTAAADHLRQQLHGNTFFTCGIINAKSGGCSEDCHFCAQSRHTLGATGKASALIQCSEAESLAALLDAHGVARLSLVTSGRAAGPNTMQGLAGIYQHLRDKYGFRLCGSLGLLTTNALHQLRRMGVERYHCNLETSSSFFSCICQSHTLADKLHTLHDAHEQGLSLCSGGIFGLGESMAQRLELALELRTLGIRSVPLNLMTPLPGTPMAHRTPLPLDEALRSIALFRLMLPQAVLRMAGGRQQLGNEQYLCFRAGANGAIVGNYLTTKGNPLAEDLAAIRALGYQLEDRT